MSSSVSTADGLAAAAGKTLSDAATRWLEDRGLDVELAVKHGWHSNDRGELVIPYTLDGEVVNHKYRGLQDKRFRQDANAVKCLWNRDVLADCAGQTVIIAEGECDALAFEQAGFPFVVSVPDGAPAEALGSDYEGTKYSYLDAATLKLLEGADAVVIATDNDEQGNALAFDLALRIGRARCKSVLYPKLDASTERRLKDGNATLEVYGEKALAQVVERAKWWSTPAIRRMSEIPPPPETAVYTAGIAGFDELYKIRLGDFAVWTGIPGDGKSTFVGHVVCSACERNDWSACWLSFEQHPRRDHQRNLRSWYLRQPAADASPEKVDEADRWIERRFCFLNPEDEEPKDLTFIEAAVEAAVKRYDSRIFVIDPWNELEHDRERDESLTEYVGRAIRTLKRLAGKFGVHMMVVAHPTKIEAGKPPSLYQISDSAHWANKPDLGMVVWRPEPEGNKAEVYNRKARYEEIGRRGTATFQFNNQTRRFEFIDPEHARLL